MSGFADSAIRRRYRGRCRLPTPPLYCATIRLYQTWQAMRKLDKAWCVAFKFCTRPGYLASGLQKVGPEPSSSLLSLSTKRICNNHHDGTILIPLQLIFLLICDMTRNSHWFVLQFRSSMAKSLENEPNWACFTKQCWQARSHLFDKNENLATIVGWNFGNFLVLLPIFSNMLITIHAQSPSYMHSSGLDLIGYY